MEYQISDIIKLKNSIHVEVKEWEILRVGCRLSTEMHGVWTSGYGVPEAGGKKNTRGIRKA